MFANLVNLSILVQIELSLNLLELRPERDKGIGSLVELVQLSSSSCF